MDLDNLHIILEIMILLLGLYLAFFKSYLQEKGKNLATKEDVHEITLKIEKIRHDLHFETESKLSLKAEERNAIVNYYTKYFFWLNTILEARPSNVAEQSETGFEEIKERIYKAKFEFEIARGNFAIFVNNPEITNLEEKTLFRGTLKLQNTVEHVMIESAFLHLQISLEKKRMNISQLTENYRSLLEKKRDTLQLFYEEKLKNYKELIVGNKALRDLVYDHIKKLSLNA